MNKKNIQQAVRFGMVGILNTAVDYAVFYIMLSVVNADKNISQIAATGVVMCGSYIMNKNWTFGKKGKTRLDTIKNF